MNPKELFKSAAKTIFTNPRSKAVDLSQTDLVGWHGIGGINNTLDAWHDDSYENAYPSISRIANEAMATRVYAVDSQNKRKDDEAIVKALYHPNQQMSGVAFREALAIMYMVHPKTYLLAWRIEDGEAKAGGPIDTENIAGFTFLENVREIVSGGVVSYQSGSNNFSTQDVLVLPGFNPSDVTGGYSPSVAARRWLRLDDFIADHQAGFFRNGGVPKGVLTITAKTQTDFKNIRDTIIERHQGAGNNDKLTFSHRPLNGEGRATEGQTLEWTPFGVDNKSLDLSNILKQVDKKIDSSYGVPASIRGVNDNNTYASVRVDEAIFIRYVVKPFLTKLWTQFTHEMNRLTGGLGVALTFDIEIPNIAEEEKIIAEKRKVNAETLTALTTEGYTLESVVEYLDTGNLSKLIMGEGKTVDDEDNADVDDGNEVDQTPEQQRPEDNLQANKVAIKRIQENDQQTYIDKLSTLTRQQTERQVTRALASLDVSTKAYGDTNDQEDEEFAEAILAALVPLIVMYGQRQTNQGVDILLEARLDADSVTQFQMNATQQSRYRKYLKRVARSYSDDTGEIIRQVLERSVAEGLSEGEIKRQIRLTLTGADNEYRVRRLARTEVVSSEGRASVAAMDSIQRETGYKIYKVWTNGGSNPCEFCKSLNGTRKLVNENFIDLDEEVHGVDGGVWKNSFAARETCTAHPSDECYSVYEVEA